MANKCKKNIIIATSNVHKLEEINAINTFEDICFDIVKGDFNPIEDGESYEENAYIKAYEASKIMKTYCLADDSGLSVTELNGAPGFQSARYAKTQNEKINKLLFELKDVPFEKRDAYFISVMVLVDRNGNQIHSTRGIVHGLITDIPKGTNGFGYDPVFYLEEYRKTMAEIDTSVKNTISHRALALTSMLNWIHKNLDTF